ncbi:MAG: molybdopterin-dependent oxidoreductase, partial [Caldimonas sp.]
AGSPLKACVLLNVDPMLDLADGPAALATLRGAEMVVSLTPFMPQPGDDAADVLLPIAPFTETSGTFVNAGGRAQSFHGVVRPLGDARPAWKVLRVLGNLLGLNGFAFETSEAVCEEALGDVATLGARLAAASAPALGELSLPPTSGASGLERIADVPIYATDPIVRRAPALQLTADARPPTVGVPSELAAARGIVEGTMVRVSSGNGDSSTSVTLAAHVDPSLAANVLRVPAGHPLTAPLGAAATGLVLAVVPMAAGATAPTVA